MPTRFAKNIIWLWLISLFLSTVGVGIETIYCYCSGTTGVALFSSGGCQHGSEQAAKKSCCVAPYESNFQVEKTCSALQISKQKKDCCTKTGFQFVKLNEQFESSFFIAKVFDFQAVALPAAVFSATDIFEKSAADLPIFWAKPPPPVSGRMLRVRLCSLLFDCFFG